MNPNISAEPDLLKQYTPLVAKVVQQFQSTGARPGDTGYLHNLGLIALLQAVRQYPAMRHVPFEVFARIQIHSALLDEIQRTQNWFRSTAPTTTSTPAFA